ncbi:polyketide biosynthesis enoyl-CoA hydratase PksH [Amycolatopsis arida]|uniref:Polyketide biosynthesis enoyl-CoA hydratase PksH n=1 Tax=Amycolatopsis arida TaxID=587909 RepID=A0A1I6AKR5_9PSEU|nr:enoyl-CoA hydratase/isomerase family protein [Amycolatopsis arida]TDX87344.1 polyketide biosynthesis enoyl-CoA hydratase PksH [Amycolatopsis arida]SFQ69107.1 polyketide biosynthesis enoyl-CoA hydratase PksH [Amycolatopsis arida]
MTAGVAIEHRGVVTHLRLCQPGNALTEPAITALLCHLRAAERAPRCRAVVLTSTGDAFCSGVDLTDLAGDPDAAERVSAAFWALLTAWADSPLLTVAVVEGPATGGGVGLAGAADLVLAGPRATFRLTELALGLVPAFILPFVLARTGEHRLMRLALGGAEVDASGAVELGLADELVTDAGAATDRVLLLVRRSSRPAVAGLKACRRALRPVPADYPRQATALLRRAVTDPAFVGRVDALRRQGTRR